LTHGQAVALGMVFAAWLSENLLGLKDAARVEKTLINFGLPTRGAFDVEKVFNVLKMDKKRISKTMSYILLKRIGKGVINNIDVDALKNHLTAYNETNKKIK